MTKLTPLLIALLALFSVASHAGAELIKINEQVRTNVELLESTYGITLSYEEQQEMKISLIADKVTASQTTDTTEEKIFNAVSTYEISSEVEQRQLVIEVGTNGAGNAGGAEPPK